MQITLETRSRGLSLTLWFFVFFLIIAGAYIIYSGAAPVVLGWLPLILGVLLLVPITRGVDLSRRLVINDVGVDDSRFAVGMIPWSEIASVSLEAKYNNTFLCMRLKNVDKFLAKMPHAKQMKFRQNAALGFNTLNVSVSGLEVDPLDLLEYVRERVRLSAGAK